MVDPGMIPNADQHLREYQALQPPRIVCGAGSLELLATGTAKLTICVDGTAGIQREVNMSVMLVPGLGRNLLSSSAAIANRGRDDNICVSCAESKGRILPVKSQPQPVFSGRNPTGTAERIRQCWINVQRNVVASSLRPYQRSEC